MKRDIRELFRGEDLDSKKLPPNHRIEFTEKLKFSKTEKPKKGNLGIFLKFAASFVLIIAAGYYIMNQKSSKIKGPTPLELQVQQIEQDYLREIDNEWQNFVKIAYDQKLIDRYKEKLNNLDNNYKEISKSFNESPNNITVLEGLIGNLQTRLQLLKNIQNHIKILNEKQRTNETIIL
ncbi:hypothetical protein [Aureibaculum conchae]|uniref:hypothetical protein n=1 Tax=Aureibaculum sp. 2308TA14-22 TaxID=3108392 RepID=UPI0033978B47